MEMENYREIVKENAVRDLIGMGVKFGQNPDAASYSETKKCFEAAKAIGARPKHIYYGSYTAAYNYFNKVWRKMQQK